MTKIAVFPASGALDGGIAKHLLKLVNPSDVGLIARSPEKIPKEYTDAGATVRKADYDDIATSDHVFTDVSTLLLVSYPSLAYEA